MAHFISSYRSDQIKDFSKRCSGANLASLLRGNGSPTLQDLCLRALIEEKEYKCTPTSVLPPYMRKGRNLTSQFLQLHDHATGLFSFTLEIAVPKMYKIDYPSSHFRYRKHVINLKYLGDVHDGGNLSYDTMIILEEADLTLTGADDYFRYVAYSHVPPTSDELLHALRCVIIYRGFLSTYLFEPLTDSEYEVTVELRTRFHYRMILDERGPSEILHFNTRDLHVRDKGSRHSVCPLLSFTFLDLENILTLVSSLCEHIAGTLTLLREMAQTSLESYLSCEPTEELRKYEVFRKNYLCYNKQLELHEISCICLPCNARLHQNGCVCLPCRYLMCIVSNRVDHYAPAAAVADVEEDRSDDDIDWSEYFDDTNTIYNGI